MAQHFKINPALHYQELEQAFLKPGWQLVFLFIETYRFSAGENPAETGVGKAMPCKQRLLLGSGRAAATGSHSFWISFRSRTLETCLYGRQALFPWHI